MRGRSLPVLTLILAAGAAGCKDRFGPSGFHQFDAGQITSREDSGSGLQDGSPDLDAGAEVAPAFELSDAVVTLAEPVVSSCARIDEGAGQNPALFGLGDRWYAFYTEGGDNTAPLNLRIAAASGLDFGDPAALLYGARTVDLIQEAGILKALAARQYYAVLLESSDGSNWAEQGNVGPDEPTYLCDHFPPALFFRGRSPVAYLAMGNDYNTGIFGCTQRVFVGKKEAAGWSVPTQVGQGDAVFAFAGEERLTLVATFGVYTSLDEGATFSELPNGDTTASQLRGTGGAWAGGRLVIVQTYNYASEDTITAILSDDEGATWPRRIALHRGAGPYFAPTIAADGDRLAVAWIAAGDAWVMSSPDRGERWSPPARFTDGTGDAGVSALSVAALGRRLAVAYARDGIVVCAGQAGD